MNFCQKCQCVLAFPTWLSNDWFIQAMAWAYIITSKDLEEGTKIQCQSNILKVWIYSSLFSHARFNFGSQRIHSSNLSLIFLLSWTFVWGFIWINFHQLRLPRRNSHRLLIQKKPCGCLFISLSHSPPPPCGSPPVQKFSVACVMQYPVSCVHWISWTDWALSVGQAPLIRVWQSL